MSLKTSQEYYKKTKKYCSFGPNWILLDDGYHIDDTDIVIKYDDILWEEGDYYMCEECKKIVHTSKRSEEDCPYCTECREHYVKCVSCNDYINISDAILTEDTKEYYCDYCADSDLYCCNVCGKYFAYSDNGFFDDDWDESWYCEDHIPKHFIEDYHTMKDNENFSFHKLVNEESPLFMGFELEADGGYTNEETAEKINDIMGNFIHFENDGSLNSGFENITEPASLAYHMSIKDKYEEMLDILKIDGYDNPDNSCGFHIHLDNAYFEDIDAAQAKMVYLFEKFDEELTRFSRRTNGEKLEWAGRYSYFDRYGDKKYDKIIEAKKEYQLNRYYAVNLTNKKTTEIRLWKGTTNLNALIATLKLTARIAELCKTFDNIQLANITWEEVLGNDENIITYWNSLI